MTAKWKKRQWEVSELLFRDITLTDNDTNEKWQKMLVGRASWADTISETRRGGRISKRILKKDDMRVYNGFILLRICTYCSLIQMW